MDAGARRAARIAGQLLVLVMLLVSPRAMLAPATITHKAQDSKRPKTPKNIVRAEPVRIPAAEKQTLEPSHLGTVAEIVPAAQPGIQVLPRKAFTQLTKPEYLKSDSPGSPHIPLSPPV